MSANKKPGPHHGAGPSQPEVMSASAPQSSTYPAPRKPGRPVGTTAAITLNAVLPQVRCRAIDLATWQGAAEAEGIPFAEWCRQQLNAGAKSK